LLKPTIAPENTPCHLIFVEKLWHFTGPRPAIRHCLGSTYRINNGWRSSRAPLGQAIRNWFMLTATILISRLGITD